MQRILVPTKNQPQHDLVYTPRDLAKQIIDHFHLYGLVLDPCKGHGSFYDQFPSNVEVDFCEIEDNRDFFNYYKHVNWIVTNPPWSKFKDFLVHSMKLSDNIVFLVTINHFMTKARMRLLKQYNFMIKEIYGVATPKFDWPQSGFQLAAVYIKKDENSSVFTGTYGL